jgi:hypothetical protein
MPAAVPAIPPNPKIAATKAMMKNIAAQLNIGCTFHVSDTKMFIKLSSTINRRVTNNMGGLGVFTMGQAAGVA